jgi:hypothetical protein
MSGKLRWDDPPCGREGFDGRASWEWEHGPYPNDTKYSIPDVPWNKLKAAEVRGPRLLWDNGQWAVTTFGLQPLHSNPSDERYEAYQIPAACLLQMHDRGPVYFWPVHVAAQHWLALDGFEEAFRKALEIHSRKYGLVPDGHILATSFRRARGMQRGSSRRRAAA